MCWRCYAASDVLAVDVRDRLQIRKGCVMGTQGFWVTAVYRVASYQEFSVSSGCIFSARRCALTFFSARRAYSMQMHVQASHRTHLASRVQDSLANHPAGGRPGG